MNANHVEREINHQLRTRNEQAGAPECRAEREAPFGRSKRRIQLPNLEESHGRVIAIGHHREANVPSSLTLALRPLMNRSNPSMVVGGGEMKRVTSSVVSSVNSEVASLTRSSRNVMPLA